MLFSVERKQKTMLYNVAQLMKASVGTSLEDDIHEEDIQLDEDLKVIGPIDGHVRIRRTNQGLLVDGWVDLTLELTCTRCLKIFEQPIHVTFMEQFHPTVDIITGVALPPIEEEDVFPIDDHHLIDITEAIRQQVLLHYLWLPCARKIAQDSVHNADMISILALVIANQKLIHASAYLKNYCKTAQVQSHNH